ncbi:2Fe-2S iron-sulfur cluster-binding protein [Microaerobacter geothermalis]|uniref:2Fe-2S iron-sulfur cluster-binding protein n=1 Tax=Microaerobacter geothermalis TaxID=674972 RepID=UPI001F1F730C|nr:2Fe-2S iron-sulfur cluster-binding protein [Microaerobacter geothermalis]MCF6093533.1 2Fe-2S iron-sulfur cluster-binding protein [Microaerobacter geothermalis]
MKVELLILPEGKKVIGNQGLTVLEIAKKNRVFISSKCNGKASCSSCKIKVINGNFSPVNELERRRLSENQIKDGYRLACQLNVVGGGSIEIPEDPFKAVVRAKLAAQAANKEDLL